DATPIWLLRNGGAHLPVGSSSGIGILPGILSMKWDRSAIRFDFTGGTHVPLATRQRDALCARSPTWGCTRIGHSMQGMRKGEELRDGFLHYSRARRHAARRMTQHTRDIVVVGASAG